MLFRPGSASPSPSASSISARHARRGFDNFGYPLFAALRERSTLFERMSAISFQPRDEPERWGHDRARVCDARVRHLLRRVGTRPATGRFFLPEEDRSPGAAPVIVLSHGFWMSRFKGDPAAVGTSLTSSGRAYDIVGVAEPGFTGTSIINADFWVPFAMEQHVRSSDTSLLSNPDAVWHTAIGRLKPGVSIAQAKDELNAIMTNDFKERGDERLDQWTIAVSPSSRIPAPARAR